MKKERGLRFLYHTVPGRALLRVAVSPFVSRVCGAFLSLGVSKALIGRFIRKNGIAMEDYTERPYKSFNDFFTRELKPGARSVDMDESALIAPCDGRLSVYALTDDCRMKIKSCEYTVGELLGGDSELACELEGGLALVFRLCVDDYHRYCFFDDGSADKPVFVPGVLHTVRPIALESTRVFAQNAREYCALHTDGFGLAVQVEVGAMMVGKISNIKGVSRFSRGQLKGMFEFGGSTVVLLLQRDKAGLRPDLQAIIGLDTEIRVRMGEKLGEAR